MTQGKEAITKEDIKELLCRDTENTFIGIELQVVPCYSGEQLLRV